MKILKSIGAVLAGMLLVFGLSILTDVLLETNGWMKIPFVSNPLWLMLLVVVYRNVYVALGAYITAGLAPDKPMQHVWAFAALGFVLGTAGTIAMWHEPPHWYPIALVILGVPVAWLGGKLRTK